VNEVTRERAQSFLTEMNQEKILAVYRGFADAEGFSRVVGLDEIRNNNHNLNIPLYVRKTAAKINADQNENNLTETIAAWEQSSLDLRESMNNLFAALEENR
jgi:type I restriction enzyme M protein